MKKVVLSIICMFSIVLLMGQNVPRSFVAVEDGTSTLCTYCPGAAMGCDDLLENGCNVAVIANHSNLLGTDPYTNTMSTARNSMWGISALPTVTLDGATGVVGGSHTASLYSSYLPLYNSAIAVTSPVSMSMAVTNTGLDYTIVVTITKVGTIASTSNILYFFVTQSGIIQNWEGQTHLEHVMRAMLPDQNGTAITFPGGTTQTVTLNATMNAAWPLANCEFIALLQNKDAGQGIIPGTSSYPVKKYTVLQCIKKGVAALTADFTADNTLVPRNGTVTFSGTSTGGFVGTPKTYSWLFPGGDPSSSTEQNPSVVYTECGPHDVTLTVNNSGEINTVQKTAYIQVGPNVNIFATPNDTTCQYQPITLYAYPANASYLWSPGGETTQSIVVDGGIAGLGVHTYSVDVTSDGCLASKTSSVFFDACAGIPQVITQPSVSIYPNPNNGVFTFELNTPSSGLADISVMNAPGSTVYSENQVTFNGKLVKAMNLKNLPAGVYFLVIRTGETRIVKKIFID